MGHQAGGGNRKRETEFWTWNGARGEIKEPFTWTDERSRALQSGAWREEGERAGEAVKTVKNPLFSFAASQKAPGGGGGRDSLLPCDSVAPGGWVGPLGGLSFANTLSLRSSKLPFPPWPTHISLLGSH